MLKSFYWAELPLEELTAESFKKKYGTIIEDVKIESMTVFFYPLFLLRRFVYALLLILLYEHPNVQLMALIIVTIIPVFYFHI